MKLKRKTLNVRHTVRFPRVTAGLMFPSGHLLETLLERLGGEYSLSSQDVSIRTGATLDDWLIRISMFNRLGTIDIRLDGVQASFKRLATDADIGIVVDVQTRLMQAIADHLPTLRVANESISSDVTYIAIDGESARADYFSGIVFPGRSHAHQDVSFRARLRHPQHDVSGMFEVAPIWANASDVLLSFDADTSQLADAELSKRVLIADDLVKLALASFDLKVEEAAP